MSYHHQRQHQPNEYTINPERARRMHGANVNFGDTFRPSNRARGVGLIWDESDRAEQWLAARDAAMHPLSYFLRRSLLGIAPRR